VEFGGVMTKKPHTYTYRIMTFVAPIPPSFINDAPVVMKIEMNGLQMGAHFFETKVEEMADGGRIYSVETTLDPNESRTVTLGWLVGHGFIEIVGPVA
jgi:hypothetical protein